MPQRSVPLSITGIVVLAVAAEGLLTLMDAMIKVLSPRYHTFEIAFLRFAFGMVGAIVYALWTRPGRPTRDATLFEDVSVLVQQVPEPSLLVSVLIGLLGWRVRRGTSA